MGFDKFVREYLHKGLLKRQEVNVKSIDRILLRAQKDLRTAKANLAIDEGIAYTVAYLAMLHAGRAVMFLKGYRPDDGCQHKTVVEFVFYVMGAESKELVNHFDKMRRKRNAFTYDVDIAISKTEAENALKTATKFVCSIKEIIKKDILRLNLNFKAFAIFPSRDSTTPAGPQKRNSTSKQTWRRSCD